MSLPPFEYLAPATTAELTGLPTDDPYRFGGAGLFAGIRAALEAAGA